MGGGARPWLIGEFNPYQIEGDDVDPYALYPEPMNSAGGRLCRLILRMDVRTYLATFERRNLLQRRWSMPKARVAAARLLVEAGAAPLVLFGRKVQAAFGLPSPQPFTIQYLDGDPIPRRSVAIIPHPSGLNRAWHQPGAVERARTLVLSLLQQQEANLA